MTRLAFAVSLVAATAAGAQRNGVPVAIESHGATVVGRFYAAAAPHPYTLLFTQGFMDSGDPWGIGKTLAARGINVLEFDFRGCFASGGTQGLIHSQEDIGAALAYLRSDAIARRFHVDPDRIVVGGYSYGGHMSMLYALHHPEITRVISISGGDLGVLAEAMRNDSTLRRRYAALFRSLRRPNGPVTFQYDDPTQELLDHAAYFSLRDQAAALAHTDVLMTNGLDDHEVRLEVHMLPLYRALKANKGQRIRFIVYQTDHSYDNVAPTLAGDVAAWILGGGVDRP